MLLPDFRLVLTRRRAILIAEPAVVCATASQISGGGHGHIYISTGLVNNRESHGSS